MRIISKKRLKDSWTKYPDSEKPLIVWYSLCKKGNFDSFSNLREIFKSADVYKDNTIFNIGGNKYRLIANIRYKIKTIFIRGIYTHKEYDKGWKNE